MALLDSLNRLTIDSPPSCVEFCPGQPGFAVIGTYVLEQADESQADAAGKAQRRTGSLMLYELHDADLLHLQTIPLPSAVLDVQWTPHRHPADLLAVAGSTGTLAFFQLVSKQLSHLATAQIAEPTNLVLDLVWHPREVHIIGVTLSDGSVALCHFANGADGVDFTRLTSQVVAQHQLEPWTLAFSKDGKHIFSGGDDMILQCTSIDQESEQAISVWRDRKAHSAGVVAILPITDTLTVTGSYDDRIRLLDGSGGRRVSTLAEADLGGGVWRLKLLRHTLGRRQTLEELNWGGNSSKESVVLERYIILASCMHAGVRVVELTKASTSGETAIRWSFGTIARFEEHKSMNYGSDVHSVEANNTSYTIVSTSFYDRLICVWRCETQDQQEHSELV